MRSNKLRGKRMAFANNINKDMTAADARAVGGSQSWADIYPKDFDFESDPVDYIGDRRLFFDTNGEIYFASGKNPFSGDLTEKITAGEKDGLLARRASGDLGGAIRDTRGRYGEPKEWDHVVLGLTRAESAALGEDGIKTWMTTVVQAMQDSPAGDGKRQMLVTPIHNDTDQVHIQVLLHRIPVDENNKTAGASFELSRNSEAASNMKRLNESLEAAGLPMISDFRMGAYSVTEPRASSTEELERASERIIEAGGQTPPDLTKGPISEIKRQSITPEMRYLDALLADAVKRQKEVESAATAAATAVAAAQHAKEALTQYESEVQARQGLETSLADEVKAREELQSNFDNLDLQNKELGSKLDAVEAEKSELSNELGALASSLDEERKGRAADDAAAIDRETKLQAEKDELTQLLKDTREALKASADELAADRASFADRARQWADENVTGPLKSQVEELKTELSEVREEMANAQKEFMQQLRDLTSNLRNNNNQKTRFPDWAQKPFNQLSRDEKAAAQKSLTGQIEAGRISQDIPLEEYVNGVHDRYLAQQENEQGSSPDATPPKI